MNKLLLKIHNYFLSRDCKGVTRIPKIYSFKEVSNIGIVYPLEHETTYNVIVDLVKNLQSQKKNVKAIAYLPEVKLLQQYIPKIDFEFYTKKDFNWYYKPQSHSLLNFIQQEYDLLIDLSINECPPLQYIVGLAKANLKVGKLIKDKLFLYDLMINIEKTPNIRIEEFINHILFYLNNFNEQPKKEPPKKAKEPKKSVNSINLSLFDDI